MINRLLVRFNPRKGHHEACAYCVCRIDYRRYRWCQPQEARCSETCAAQRNEVVGTGLRDTPGIPEPFDFTGKVIYKQLMQGCFSRYIIILITIFAPGRTGLVVIQ